MTSDAESSGEPGDLPKESSFFRVLEFSTVVDRCCDDLLRLIVRHTLARTRLLDADGWENVLSQRPHGKYEKLRKIENRCKMPLYAEPVEHELAMFLVGMEDFDKAREIMEECMEMQRRRLGEDSIGYAQSIRIAAAVEDASGRT